MRTKLLKFSKLLENDGLTEQSNFLKRIIAEELLEESGLEPSQMLEEGMMPEDDMIEEDTIEYDEDGELEENMPEADMEEDLSLEKGEGEEFEMDGFQTSNFHCCPEAKEALEMMGEMAGAEEESELVLELAEEVDAFLGDKIRLMEEGGEKEDLCEYIAKSLSAMYVVGQASGIMDEDLSASFQFISDCVDEVCSELLEE